MEKQDHKNHWETIYETKNLVDLSWYQAKPTSSLYFMEKLKISYEAKIIDIGGGDSFFVDHLLELGFKDITVLDISEKALEKAKARLGAKSQMVKWIVADASKFVPSEKYDFWHDRAAFHFLTQENDIEHYIKSISEGLSTNGLLLIGTFSELGPKKCSGIEIKQYSEESMFVTFKTYFDKIECLVVDHPTPFQTIQNFVFCAFRKAQKSETITENSTL